MSNDEYNIRFKKAYNEYFAIGRLVCKVLAGQTVHFRQHGFRHFLRKGKDIRPKQDQLRRFSLLRYAKTAIQAEATRITETRIIQNATYWSLEYETGENYLIKVIIRKISDGDIDFVSIMDCKKRK